MVARPLPPFGARKPQQTSSEPPIWICRTLASGPKPGRRWSPRRATMPHQSELRDQLAPARKSRWSSCAFQFCCSESAIVC